MEDEETAARRRWVDLALDVAVGVGLAALVILVILLVGRGGAGFVYEAF